MNRMSPATNTTDATNTTNASQTSNANSPLVLILGANGRIGAALVQAYAAAGWRVCAQVRRAPPQGLPVGATAVVVPLADTERLAAQAAGAKLVVYAVNPLYDRWDEELLPLARLGMEVAERLGARLMLPGNVYNYGSAMPAVLRSETPQQPDVSKGRQRVQMEGELAQRAAAGRLQATVIRAGDFYGAGSGTWFDQAIVKDISKGKLVYPGPTHVMHAWAYLPDLAQAFVAASSRANWGEAPAFETLHFAGHSCTGEEMLAGIEAAACALGLKPPGGFKRGGMPWGMVRFIGIFKPIMRELARMSYLWRVPHVLDGASLERAVGPLPTTPLNVALRATLREMGVGQPGTQERDKAALSLRGDPA
jgi:nucleoside-diphosphate-sugar epimerase